MVAKAPFKKITTEQIGVTCIMGDDKLVGIIYNDHLSQAKRIFKVEQMSEDEIAGLMERDEVVMRTSA